jgi:hypothetical protein
MLASAIFEILRLLAGGARLGEIAEANGVNYKTVANHCAQLRAMLATPRTADLILTNIERSQFGTTGAWRTRSTSIVKPSLHRHCEVSEGRRGNLLR